MEQRRLLLVSNRLPVTVESREGVVRLVESCGGLVAGLRAAHEARESLWLGWLGESPRLKSASPPELEEQLAERHLVAVPLSAQDARPSYEGFSNGVIWPLFHYLLDQLPLQTNTWAAYQRSNQTFADTVCAHYRPGDLVWVHDFHLMLVPGLLRARLSDASIGFFLHIPFPSSELFRILPWREALLESLLGADLVGFHTHAYLRHFVVSLRHLLGLDPGIEHVSFGGREVQLGVFPMGADAGLFDRLGHDDAVNANAAALRAQSGGRSLLLAIDRLDYTKGIPRRLLAFEQMLEGHPALRDRVRLLQIAVPSRAGVEPYQAFRRRVEEMVGRINGRFGGLESVPIHYLYRSFDKRQLAAMYLAADVMLVTPIRDGMNLVAKEFVASRVDGDGVLVLSEFAGAAAELSSALQVNPYDVDGLTRSMLQAVTMDSAERRARMRELRRRVLQQDVRRWADDFLHELAAASAADVARSARRTSDDEVRALVERLRAAKRIVALLDYDGTLVPFANVPELARPDSEVRELLWALAGVAGRQVHIVSGRPRETLERWFDDWPVGLWAEHGLWNRSAPGRPWQMSIDPPRDWMGKARHVLERVAGRTPGSSIEEKTASLVWHYRMVDRELGAIQARRLRRMLAAALRNDPADVQDGNRVVEVRARCLSKGLSVRRALESGAEETVVLAIGDDETDEDMFAALPPSGVAVRVGPGKSRAPYRLEGWKAVRSFLKALAADGRLVGDEVPRVAVGSAG